MLKKYDEFIKSMAYSGPKPSGFGMIGAGSILALTMPFFAAIVLISATFDTLGLTGAWWIVRIFISLVLLVAIFYSGFKFVYYRDLRNRE